MVWNLPVLITALFYFILPPFGYADSVDTKIQDGITQYHEGKFKEAGENFSSAHNNRPLDSRISYNLGNALYKEGNYQEALQAFSRSALEEKNPNIQKKSIYNTGNTMVKLGKLEEAESAYKKVLSLDPGDMDAKYNLEYVRKQLEQKKEQGSEKDQQKGEDEPSDEEKGENQEQDSQGGHKRKNQPPDNEAENKDPENNNQESQPGDLTSDIPKEKAEQMLEGLTEDLKNISRMQAGKTVSTYQGNDW